MTQLSLSARLARVTALRSEIDASGGGKMLFCAGTMPAAPEDTLTAIVLATMPLATPAIDRLVVVGATRQPMVLVTDDRFEVIGLVTLDDVLDEIIGSL